MWSWCWIMEHDVMWSWTWTMIPEVEWNARKLGSNVRLQCWSQRWTVKLKPHDGPWGWGWTSSCEIEIGIHVANEWLFKELCPCVAWLLWQECLTCDPNHLALAFFLLSQQGGQVLGSHLASLLHTCGCTHWCVATVGQGCQLAVNCSTHRCCWHLALPH